MCVGGDMVILILVRSLANGHFTSPYNNRLHCGTNQKLKSLYLRLHNTYARCFWYGEGHCQCLSPYQKSSAWVVRRRRYNDFNFWFVPQCSRLLHGPHFTTDPEFCTFERYFWVYPVLIGWRPPRGDRQWRSVTLIGRYLIVRRSSLLFDRRNWWVKLFFNFSSLTPRENKRIK